MANCPACGGLLKFNISSQKVKCDSCDSQFDPYSLKEDRGAKEATGFGQNEGKMQLSVFTCPNCAGEIYSTEHDMTGRCAYCGAFVNFTERLVNATKPKYIIPFKKTKEECKEIFSKTMEGNLFADRRLKDPDFISEFRGIYMPYYIKKVSHKGDGINIYAETEKERGDDTITDTYRYICDIDASYSNLSHDASSFFADDLSEQIEPFLFKENEKSNLQKFAPGFLYGFYAEPKDTDEEDYAEYFDNLAVEYTADYVKNHESFTGDGAKILPAYDFPAYDKLKEVDSSKVGAFESFKGQKDKKDKNDKKKKSLFGLSEDEKAFEAEEKRIKAERNKLSSEEDAAKLKYDELRYGYDASSDKAEIALLPVWFLSYANKDRVGYMTVNGQTGRVSADLSIDLRNFFIFSGILTAIITVISYMMMLRPSTLATFGVWFSSIALVIYKDELGDRMRRIMKRSGHAIRDEERGSGAVSGLLCLIILMVLTLIIAVLCGISSDFEVLRGSFAMGCYAFIGLLISLYNAHVIRKLVKKLDASERGGKFYIFSILAAIAGCVIVWINPNSDYLYYLISCLCLAGIVVTMMSLVLFNNKYSMRPIPQFEHKGGDDGAR